MKLTKFGHSCIYVEVDSIWALFDPGAWATSYNISKILKLDYVVYTHEHQDHFDTQKLSELVIKFPDITVVCNASIKEKIAAEGINVSIVEEDGRVVKFNSNHEALPIPGAEAPTQNGYHFMNLFTHPGDSHHFAETKKVLALPLNGPWGKPGDAIDLTLKLKPEYVITIHDWHYSDEGRHWYDGVLKNVLENAGTKVLSSDSEQTHDIT